MRADASTVKGAFPAGRNAAEGRSNANRGVRIRQTFRPTSRGGSY